MRTAVAHRPRADHSSRGAGADTLTAISGLTVALVAIALASLKLLPEAGQHLRERILASCRSYTDQRTLDAAPGERQLPPPLIAVGGRRSITEALLRIRAPEQARCVEAVINATSSPPPAASPRNAAVLPRNCRRQSTADLTRSSSSSRFDRSACRSYSSCCSIRSVARPLASSPLHSRPSRPAFSCVLRR